MMLWQSAAIGVFVRRRMKNSATFKEVISIFIDGATEGISATGTLKIKGNQLIHYKTPVAERYGESIIVNTSRYSLATGQLQKQILSIVPPEKRIIVKRVPIAYNGSLSQFVTHAQGH